MNGKYGVEVVDISRVTHSIAVVIPLFNHEFFIEEALISVLENSVNISEIILIDDGSKDKGLSLVR